MTTTQPHTATAKPEGTGYLVTCPRGCDLGTSARVADLDAAERRISLHRIATEVHPGFHDDQCENRAGGEYDGKTIGNPPTRIPCHCPARAEGRAQADREIARNAAR